MPNLPASESIQVRLQNILHRFEKLTGSTAVFLLPNGEPAQTEDYSNKNLEKYKDMCREVASTGHSFLRRGPEGLWLAALPVNSPDGLLGVWLLDGFCYAGEGEVPDTSPNIPMLNQASLTILEGYALSLSYEMGSLMRERTLAYQDPLLHIPNQLALDRDIQTGRYQYLLLLDVQGLRKINDVYGREFGDRLLKAVCEYIQGLEIPGAPLYRSGIADFVLLLNSDAEDLRRLAQKLQKRCNKPWPLDAGDQKQDLFISLSIGLLPLAEQLQNDYSYLTSAMEYTLDLARKNNGLALFDDSESTSFRSRMALELGLRQSVQENMRGFYVMYQPIVDPGTATWCGLEALCRWTSPDFGPISPSEFIPIAESTGHIYTLGHWVLEEALRQVKHWRLDQNPTFLLNVNLSPVQLLNPALYADVAGLLEKYDYPPHKLCLEITESNELNFAKHSQQAIRELDLLGVVFALDDFGSGYASLNSLHMLPTKLVKTDRSLIANVENDLFLQRVFNMLVEVAHASDMKIVAEGVENRVQAMLLLKSGADHFQGFHFSRPLTTRQLDGLLGNFEAPLSELVALGYTSQDITQLEDEEIIYELPPRLSKLLSHCLRLLYATHSGAEAINTALSRIGQGLNVDRAYVFERESDGTFTNTYEWCAEGIKPEKDNLVHADIQGLSPGWIRTLTEDGLLVAADIRQLDPNTFGVLCQQGIKAVVEIPIMRDGKLHGFVGFDDCESVRHWSREEIQMLHTLTGTIAATMRRMQLEDRTKRQNERMHQLLNAMGTQVYVSDPGTDKILFANGEIRRVFGQDMVGHTCWEALQNRTERCDFCPLPRLLQNPGEPIIWEYYNEVAKGYYQVQNSIIPWEDGRVAHLQYALDITELRELQQKQKP